MGMAQNDIVMQPTDLSIRAIEGQGKLSRVDIEQQAELEKALANLKSGERAKILGELSYAAQLLNKYKDENGNLIYDPAIIAQELSRFGVKLKPEHLKGISRFDPKELEHMHKMELMTNEQAQHTGRALEHNETELEKARIAANAKDHSAAGMSARNKKELTDEFAELREEEITNGSLPPRKQARKEAIQMFMREANYQQEAQGARESSTPAKTIDKIKESRQRQKDIQERFSKDPNMKNYKLGPYDPDKKSYSVINPNTGVEIGDYE
jgi:hypothetical protein